MATQINKLVTKFVADTSQLEKGAKKAVAAVAAFSAAAVAAFTAVGVAVNNTTAKMDSLIKTASKLDIGVNQLRELQFQAQLAGVSTETLNMALQRMTRRVAEASMDLGEAKDALKELNLNASDLVNLSPDKQFRAIADAMSEIGSKNQQLRLAFKIFDSEGVGLVNLMRTELDKTAEAFRSLGIELTGEQIAAIESYRDSVTTLTTAWDGFLAIVSAEVAPIFEQLIAYVVEFIRESGGMRPIAQAFAQSIMQMVSALISGFRTVGEWIDFIGRKIEFISEDIASMLDRFALVGSAISAGSVDPGTIGTLQERREARGGSNEEPGGLGDLMGKLFDDSGLKSFIPSINKAAEATDQYTNSLLMSKNAIDGMINNLVKGESGNILNTFLGDAIKQSTGNASLESAGAQRFGAELKDLFSDLSGPRGSVGQDTDVLNQRLNNLAAEADILGPSFQLATDELRKFAISRVPQLSKADTPEKDAIKISGKIEVAPDKVAFIEFTQEGAREIMAEEAASLGAEE